MIPTNPIVANTIRNVKKEKSFFCHSFTLPAIYSEFTLQSNFIEPVFVDSVIKYNNIDFAESFTTVKHFIKFLSVLKGATSNELGNNYRLEVLYSLDYMDRWEDFEHKFIIDEHNALVE